MIHRHLNGEGYSLTKIEDIIERGEKKDWVLLQQAVRKDLSIAKKVHHIASYNLDHPYTIRFRFWLIYSKKYGGSNEEEK